MACAIVKNCKQDAELGISWSNIYNETTTEKFKIIASGTN